MLPMVEDHWNVPSAPVDVHANACHAWRVDLSKENALDYCASLLSTDESERAGRFRFERDRNRYVLARGALRDVLAGYLHLPAGAIRFTYNTFGKPTITDGEGCAFNLSHSGDLALIAVTDHASVGIDVEQRSRQVDIEGLTRRFFCPSEAGVILGLAGEEQRQAFFNGWTRKEAFLKARGIGVTLGLQTFEVTVRPGDTARLLSVHGDEDEARSWTLQALEPGPGYAAAVAVEGTIKATRLWTWAKPQ